MVGIPISFRLLRRYRILPDIKGSSENRLIEIPLN